MNHTEVLDINSEFQSLASNIITSIVDVNEDIIMGWRAIIRSIAASLLANSTEYLTIEKITAVVETRNLAIAEKIAKLDFETKGAFQGAFYDKIEGHAGNEDVRREAIKRHWVEYVLGESYFLLEITIEELLMREKIEFVSGNHQGTIMGYLITGNSLNVLLPDFVPFEMFTRTGEIAKRSMVVPKVRVL